MNIFSVFETHFLLTLRREDDFEANQSELKYLRIQLQAIEAQRSQHVQQVDDQDLSDSIINWKINWEDIDRRSKERKDRYQLALTQANDTNTVGIPLRTERKMAMIQKVV